MEENNKCVICGKNVPSDKSFNSKLEYKNIYCDDCLEIAKLEKISINHWDSFKQSQIDDPVEQRNYHKDKEYAEMHYATYTLDNSTDSYHLKNRSKKTKEFIDELDKARMYIYTDIKPYMLILESMFDKKYTFWADGGNCWYYIRNSLISYLVIHIKEYFDNSKQNKSKLSVYRFTNIIKNNKNDFYIKPAIIHSRQFEKSGDVSNVEFRKYPIDEYLYQLDVVLKSYKPIIQSIEDYRDNVYAHVNELRNKEDHQALMTLENFRKIINALTVIFDGLYYSIAPDKYATIRINHNLWINRLNEISKFYAEHIKKLQEHDG